MTNWLKDAAETVDSSVFTGEDIWDDAKRIEFREYLDRWSCEVTKIEHLRWEEGYKGEFE